MLRIGYVRLRDQDSAVETSALKTLGCHVVRAEEPQMTGGDESAVLLSILDFVGAGDQLVVTRLNNLGDSARAVLDVLDRLQQRGAVLVVAEPELTSEGLGGRALRAALEAVASIEPHTAPRRRRPAADEILELQRAGVGPVEIARRLGVSRMTVWRKLKSVEA
ncbi:recombinase family protein [Phenylobacterium sp. LjRoot225]|uniref:recombinase family protein n=1 Tax=Phenylobacterium sp. LjRoot225 TaxID=3342285 RepID=UPI003ECD79D8